MVYGDASIMVGRRGVGGMDIRRESGRAMERMEGEEEEESGRQKVSERMGEKKGSKEKYLMGSNLIHRAHPVPVSGLCFFKFLTISGVQVAVDGHFFIAATRPSLLIKA